MAITNSSLRNSIFNEIKLLLTGLNYYNNSNTSVSGVTVTSAYVDDDAKLPQVVINTANVAKDEPSYDRSNMTNNIQVMIDIYTKKKKNEDYIIDQIDNISGLKTISGLMLIAWDETQAYSPVNDNKVHLKSITLTFKRR